MADKDNRYSTSAVKKMSQCHVSVEKTSLAKPKFDRWRDLNSAIIDWINNDAIEETSVKVAERNNFQSYDPIQKKFFQIFSQDLEQFIQKGNTHSITNISQRKLRKR